MKQRLAIAVLVSLAGASLASADEAKLRHGRASRSDTSTPLRELGPPATVLLPFGMRLEVPFVRPAMNPTPTAAGPESPGPIHQKAPGSRQTPSVQLSFEGMAAVDNEDLLDAQVVPPDTNGDVGFDHLGNKIYIQAINLVWGIFDTSNGARISGPTAGNSFWAGFGGECEANNDGDPVVLYDDYAGRWVFSQFVRDTGLICVAVSATSDPLGSYHRYEFQIGTETGTADYPKMGVWPQGPEGNSSGGPGNQSSYTLTTRNFPFFDDTFMNSVLLERDRMLAGDPAAQLVSLAHSCEIFPTECLEGQVPPHFAGPPPPFGSCPTFVAVRDFPYDDTTVSSDGVRLDRICVKWDDVENSTFANTFLQSAPFSRQLGDGYEACISERPAPGELLACLTRFTMFRLQFRYFDGSDGNGEHFSGVFNSTVRVVPDGPEPIVAGVMWMEIRSDNGVGGWNIHQQGTYGPEDGRERWMGSIAQNGERTIAVGYNRTSLTEEPSLYYTSRFFDDPAGEMGSEALCHDGTGVQTISGGRWGDYSSMSVDPEDDCTFWFTGEYYETTGPFNFKTRICSFNGCDLAPAVAITTPTDGAVFDDQTMVGFTGSGIDEIDGDLTANLAWTSSLDGSIGSGGSFAALLSAGPHTIETSVTDSRGKTGTAQIDLSITTDGCPAQLDIEAGSIVGVEERRAVDSISVLSGVTVEGSGDLRVIAGRSISVDDGFEVLDGGTASFETTSTPCS